MSKNLVGFLDMGPKHVVKGINKGINKGLKRKEKTMKGLKLPGLKGLNPTCIKTGIGEETSEETSERLGNLKITEVEYRQISKDTVRIVKITNAATDELLHTTFGHEVGNVYMNGFPRYHQANDGRVVVRETIDHFDTLYPGLELSSEKFGDIIRAMKMAGSRLIHIVNEIKNKPEKTVRI